MAIGKGTEALAVKQPSCVSALRDSPEDASGGLGTRTKVYRGRELYASKSTNELNAIKA